MATDNNMEQRTGYPDGAWLAATVRVLARDVRKLVRTGGGRVQEREAVARRVQTLLDQVRTGPETPLRRWLENLSRDVETLRAAEARRPVEQTA